MIHQNHLTILTLSLHSVTEPLRAAGLPVSYIGSVRESVAKLPQIRRCPAGAVSQILSIVSYRDYDQLDRC